MDLLTVSDVARRLKIGRSTAYLLCQRGVLPVVRFGPESKLVRISAEALDRYISEQVDQANASRLSA